MKRVIFIGQAMPRFKKNLYDWPTLNSWLYSIGVDDNHIQRFFFYSALVNYFPGSKNGSHRVPSEIEIKRERKRLAKTIYDFDPNVVVTIGKLSLSYCLQEKINLLDGYIGNTYEVNPYGLYDKKVLVIPLPHPSGASTWYKKHPNRKLLNKALGLLKENL